MQLHYLAYLKVSFINHKQRLCAIYDTQRYFFFFLAVFAAALKAFAVGAPLVPGFRIFSPLPAAMRLRLA